MSGPSEIPAYVPPPPGSWGAVDDRQPLAPVTPPQRPLQTPARVRYADWGERVGAALVDWGLLLAPVIVLSILAPDSSVAEGVGGWAWLLAAGWFAWLNGAKGQSPGKALMGIKVVREVDGSTLGGPVGLARALVLTLMAIFGVGILWVLALLWPLWDTKHRALHDKIFSASVVAGYPRARFGKGIFRP